MAGKLLRLAEALVRQGWCQGSFARDARGRSVLPTDPQAASWCVRGSLIAAARRLEGRESERLTQSWALAERLLLDMIGCCCVGGPDDPAADLAGWNDARGRTAKEAAAALRAAADGEGSAAELELTRLLAARGEETA